MADSAVLGAARNAMAVNESNAKMGLVCATPTAGSAGCLPAVLTTAIEKLGLTESQQLDFLFTAGAFGTWLLREFQERWCYTQHAFG